MQFESGNPYMRRVENDTRPEDDFVYYESQNSLVPFSLTRYTTVGDKVADQLNLNKMPARELRFNRLVQYLIDTGWMEFLEVEMEIFPTDVVFRFSIKKSFTSTVESVTGSLRLFTYNMTHGRIMIDSPSDMALPLLDYSKSVAKSDDDARKWMNAYNQYRLSLEQFIPYWDASFDIVRKKVFVANPDMEFNTRMFVQLIVLRRAARATGHKLMNLNRSDILFVMGDERYWVRYLTPDANLQNLVHLFTMEFYGSGNAKARFAFPRIEFHMFEDNWDEKYLYSFEEVEGALSLPSEWFQKLFPSRRQIFSESEEVS